MLLGSRGLAAFVPEDAIGMVVTPFPISALLLLVGALPLDSRVVLLLPIAMPGAFFAGIPFVIIVMVAVEYPVAIAMFIVITVLSECE